MKDNRDNILTVENLQKSFQVKVGYFFSQKVGTIRALDDVSFAVIRGETLGLVGESGCGKTTTGRIIARLIPGDGGKVNFDGGDILNREGKELQALRRRIQFIFQDPHSSLNPRMSIFQTVSEPLKIHRLVPKDQLVDAVDESLEEVGLNSSFMDRYPHQLSGGQRQRVIIARALALKPDFIVADEPVSALDVSVQAQILNLFCRLRRERGFSALFISHDLAVIRTVCQKVAVMYLGNIVETGPAQELFASPLHPYTQGLIKSAPHVGRDFSGSAISGDLPDPVNPPRGCSFHPRCSRAVDRCRVEKPAIEKIAPHRAVACHLV